MCVERIQLVRVNGAGHPGAGYSSGTGGGVFYRSPIGYTLV